METILDQMALFNKVDTDNLNKQIINGLKHKMAKQSEMRARIKAHNEAVSKAKTEAEAKAKAEAEAKAKAEAEAKAKAEAEAKANKSKRITNRTIIVKNVDVDIF